MSKVSMTTLGVNQMQKLCQNHVKGFNDHARDALSSKSAPKTIKTRVGSRRPAPIGRQDGLQVVERMGDGLDDVDALHHRQLPNLRVPLASIGLGVRFEGEQADVPVPAN